MLFAKSRHQIYKREPWIHIAKLLNVSTEHAKKGLQKIRVVLLVDCVVQLYSNRFTSGGF